MSRKVRTRFGNTNRGPVRDEDHMMSGGLGPEPAKEPVKAKSARANGKSASKTAPKPNGILRASKSAVPVEEESWETEDDEEEVDEDEDDEDEEDDDDEEDAEEVLAALKSKMPDISRLLDSDSDDSSDEDEAVDEAEDDEDEEEEVATETNGALLPVTEDADEEKDDEDDEDDEEDIPLSDIASVASDERGDLVPYQRLTINNTTALTAAWKRIALPLSTLPFSAHQSITTAEPVQIEDVEDDLSRELAFYKQALNAVQASRPLLQKENIPFSRPTDYFAEMVKSDEHMGRVKQKLVDAAAGKKASAEAKRQRNLKKFGKQVQVAKLQERAKEKRETLDKIGALKRKRSGGPLTNETEPDMFDIELDNTASSKRQKPNGDSRGGGGNSKRSTKDAKYGFGGKKRFAKSNDAASAGEMKGFSTERMKGRAPAGKARAGKVGKSRPGKSKRAKGRL